MNRSDVCGTGVVAAGVTGGLTGVAYIGIGSLIDVVANHGTGLDPGSALVFVVIGGIVGVFTGSVLGVVPVAVAVTTWPTLQTALGEARAMDVTAAAVALMSFIEVLTLWLFFSGPDVGGAILFLFVIALISGVGARIALGLTSRSAARRLVRLTSQD